MTTIDRSRDFSVSISCITLPPSWTPRAAVGSSMIRSGRPVDGPRDRDRLALAAREEADGRAHRGSPRQLGQHLRRLPGHPLAVDPAEADGRAAEEDVLGDVEPVDEREILVDDADAAVAGLAGARQPHDLAADEQLPLVGLEGAAQDLDQRRLAGAVVPDERHRLAAKDAEVDAAQRLDRAVRLAHTARTSSTASDDAPFAAARKVSHVVSLARDRGASPRPSATGRAARQTGSRRRRRPASRRPPRSAAQGRCGSVDEDHAAERPDHAPRPAERAMCRRSRRRRSRRACRRRRSCRAPRRGGR